MVKKKKGFYRADVTVSLISKEIFMHGAHISMISLSSWL